MDLLCPLSTKCRKTSCPAPWLSDVLRNNRRELRSAERKWKKSQLDADLISYHTLLSKFSSDVTSAKTSLYKEKIEASAQDPRMLHNIFFSLLNPPAPPAPSSLTTEDFATFYTENMRRSARPSLLPNFIYITQSGLRYFFIEAFFNRSSKRCFANHPVLQSYHLSTGSNPFHYAPEISPEFLSFITTVINGSITSGHVPTAFKKARVIPILKKPALDPSDISNHRPVSLLLFLSKILELSPAE
ncbi:hypothetical protein QTP86_012079 [Hemibagrus guttatus]|nr:hypothetical protein QTP86_012079 [Hemibagrus guttatus]